MRKRKSITNQFTYPGHKQFTDKFRDQLCNQMFVHIMDRLWIRRFIRLDMLSKNHLTSTINYVTVN